jgi:hypothetical protein
MKKLFCVIVALIVLVSIGHEAIFNFNDKEYIITVTDKERIYETSSSDGTHTTTSKYLVFGVDENGETLVFENTDTFIRGKLDSSTVQGSLIEGNTYKVTVVGYRVPFFSWYENIISVEELD